VSVVAAQSGPKPDGWRTRCNAPWQGLDFTGLVYGCFIGIKIGRNVYVTTV